MNKDLKVWERPALVRMDAADAELGVVVRRADQFGARANPNS